MNGAHDLDTLLRHMDATLAEDIFVFVTLPDRTLPEGVTPQMMFQEAEGMTLILRRSDAEALGLACAFPCRMITLNIHSALDAVGFIARVVSALAAAGMGVNPVAGYFHDHLFIPDGRQNDAMRILDNLSRDLPPTA